MFSAQQRLGPASHVRSRRVAGKNSSSSRGAVAMAAKYHKYPQTLSDPERLDRTPDPKSLERRQTLAGSHK